LFDWAADERQLASEIAERGSVRAEHLKYTSGSFIRGVVEWGNQSLWGAANISWNENVSIFYHNAFPSLRSHLAARNPDSLALAALRLSNAFYNVRRAP